MTDIARKQFEDFRLRSGNPGLSLTAHRPAAIPSPALQSTAAHRRRRIVLVLGTALVFSVPAILLTFGGKAKPRLEAPSATASPAGPDLQANASGSAQKKPDPTEKARSTFADNYDAQKIANFYGAKYRQSVNYLLTIVHHSAKAAEENNVNPFILLAIISHESNFLNTARNSSGAEGLMQIMTSVHKKRFDRYGGIRMTYVPAVNIQVGATILRDCMDIMKSVRGGLSCYAGTINGDDGGFVDFVMNEANMLKRMASLPAAGHAQ